MESNIHPTAAELIDAKRAWNRADERRMALRPFGVTRSAWRDEHPVGPTLSWSVTDGRKSLLLQFDETSQVGAIRLYRAYGARELVGIIDLTASDADEQLAKLAFCQKEGPASRS